MRTIEYSPEFIPEGQTEPVKFTLRTLTHEEYGELASTLRPDGQGNMVPSYKGTVEVFKHNVVGWENFPWAGECTLKERNALLSGPPRPMLALWMGHIAGKLFIDAWFPEAERKN